MNFIRPGFLWTPSWRAALVLPAAVEDEQISVFVDLQRAVRALAAERVCGVDGGCSQSLRHGHPHVDAGQVHDDGLRRRRKRGG